MGIFTKIIGSKNDRELKKLAPTVQAINAWEPKLEKLTDAQLTARIGELREQAEKSIKDSGKTGEDLTKEVLNKATDPILPEVFGIVPRGRQARARHASFTTARWSGAWCSTPVASRR